MRCVRYMEMRAFGQVTAPLELPAFQAPAIPAKDTRVARRAKLQLLIRRCYQRFVRALARHETAMNKRLEPYVGGGRVGAVLVVAPNGCAYAFHEVHGGVLSSPSRRLLQLVACSMFGSCLGGQRYSTWLRLRLLLGGDVEANPGPVAALDIVSVTTRLATWLHDAGGDCVVRDYCLGQVAASAVCWPADRSRSGSVPCWLLHRCSDAVGMWVHLVVARGAEGTLLHPAAWTVPCAGAVLNAQSQFWDDVLGGMLPDSGSICHRMAGPVCPIVVLLCRGPRWCWHCWRCWGISNCVTVFEHLPC